MLMAMQERSLGKTVVLASADAALRQRLRSSLVGMRWNVREAAGGAEAMAELEESKPEALLMDCWLPDLEVGEFAGQIRLMYPGMDLLRVDGDPVEGVTRSPRRHELLHALREAMEEAPVAAAAGGFRPDGAAWAAAPVAVPFVALPIVVDEGPSFEELALGASSSLLGAVEVAAVVAKKAVLPVQIAGMIGGSEVMLELARLVRLVAPRRATVLIEGETGAGKEVVAQAIHRLSARAEKAFAVLNCAAIPEALLEAELFGHTRGAFTGAVTSRTGRIEAADGGTLFLDEIGEMPLALQAKMLRFLECGELQRVGDNQVLRVDVRVIAATHQRLEERATEGTFRLDLYHRLAVFPVEVPPLRERSEDIAELAEFFLAKMGEGAPRKRLSGEALAMLEGHAWPGNVRELGHVLERGTILAEDAPELRAEHVRFRSRVREAARA
jgi:DNA-binding NtrC family response regulator